MRWPIGRLVVVSCLISLCCAAELETRQSSKGSAQLPANEDFLRRSLLSVSLTLSIPLDESWTNDIVTFTESERGPSPYLEQPALWVDEERTMLYSWGGQGSYKNISSAGDHHLYAFEADDGKGSGSIHDPDDDTLFSSLYRTVRGAYASCHGVGYHLGGYGERRTDERYIYGSWNTWNDKTKAFGDVWVLSLPAFKWFKADVDSPKRGIHGCALAGKRQMLSIGGNNWGKDEGWKGKDPWTQGIGILDLPSLAWSSDHDAEAEDHQSPKVVRDWYQSGDEVEWDNREVEKLFASMSATTPRSTDGPKFDSSPDNSSSTLVGAIAGGVIGGVAAIVALVGLWLWMRRRKRKASEHSPQNSDEGPTKQWGKAELSADSSKQNRLLELDSNQANAGLPAATSPLEVNGKTQRHELEG
ncbi:kelch repeat [Fusarium denticulatum]|uniref:Kelch repeat n=1 Tax=Fusarium denticulatum TaxID=48507 RepID=A0A8H5U0X7_9HYPO|nr:kelch repeat [Fusarium denticulatum]